MINEIHFGDCRESLRAMAAAGVKVQTCVTSPPYFGLRDYGHAGQIGLEETPDQFIAELVEVFRCVRDVLADDGTLWVNIGDSYATGTTAGRVQGKRGLGAATQEAQDAVPRIGTPEGCKTKDLIGIPWMLAFALRADGWYLRQDIIWHKPNPMPESVTDRCTKAHEYVFLLSKGPRYFYDAEAVKETAVTSERDIRRARITGRGAQASSAAYLGSAQRDKSGGFPQKDPDNPVRNRRSVWTIATRPYKGAHFAVFPSALVEPCILAGTSARGHCPVCKARWVHQVEKTPMVINKTERNDERGTRTGTSGTMVSPASSITTGWTPTCACGVEPTPDIVLDPFMGSGTTAAVAVEHGRQFIGCELNVGYKPLQDERIDNAYAGGIL